MPDGWVGAAVLTNQVSAADASSQGAAICTGVSALLGIVVGTRAAAAAVGVLLSSCSGTCLVVHRGWNVPAPVDDAVVE